ncbi:MAG: Txe/YoeB family addiction module toxin [Gemmatimonadaceae bacterium]
MRIRTSISSALSARFLKSALRALALIEAVLRDPFAGVGKPEPLKGLAPNTWSRRITDEHRLVYVVFDERVVFVQARYHY